ncbi:MAG: hypothetical protein AVDCRST_MAG59-396 [uncultured Thermomicrobiales bacterium]|uniref:Uncharacterized protein n=1 Tax=uncultured Thermomicrobiales bacterium TaxID=1645740 RepID=A0A6J4U2A8_9BACT|nr:MAG: hypothetical protein AVDCRST_MAG59-396 [uncultured Thermomicrobiales bacterium]
MPASGLAPWSLGLALLVGSVGMAAPAGMAAARQATPISPAPAVEPTPAAAEPAAPAGTPQAPAAAEVPQTDVVTLAAWYATDPSGEFINVFPLATDPDFVAGPQPGAAAIGRAEFPDPAEGVPTVLFGDTNFDSYARTEGDIPERWTWFDDSEGARPATLVLQVSGLDGAYQGYFGTATFVSRDDGGAGGVLILALRPPNPAAEADTAGEGDAAEDAAAAGDAAEGDAASQPDPDIEVPTDEAAAPDA